MQEIAGIERVRYLIENAGSMVELHFHAFCELLGLSRQPKDQYLWGPADHGYPITRKRKFFRSHQDKQDIINKPLVEFDSGGPLLSREQKAITLAPLLRTREFLPFDVCWASWTLYQPSASIWDYDFWGFAKQVVIEGNKLPRVDWKALALLLSHRLERVYCTPQRKEYQLA